MENLLKRRFFYDPSFAIYDDVNGLYDYGPVGCAVKANILALCHRHFVFEEQMLEIDCSVLTPEPNIRSCRSIYGLDGERHSHGGFFRTDHLIQGHLTRLRETRDITDERKAEIDQILPQISNMNAQGMQQVIERYKIRSPNNQNELSEPMAFNLMFSTSVGPTSRVKCYLRPETTQGMFIGNAFRNGISPRSGLLRIRLVTSIGVFTMAAIEHFLDPTDKTHPKFATVANLQIELYSADSQTNGDFAQSTRLGDAVHSRLIESETLGYFLGRIYLFIIQIVIDPIDLSQPHSVVSRELDSLEQIRVNVNHSTEQMIWNEISSLHPTFTEQQTKRLQQ